MHLLRRSAAAIAAAALVLAGGSTATARDNPSNGSSVVVKAQTYNMYFGADLTPLFSGTNPVEAATAIWNEMQASRIPERARAVAEIIAEGAPDLVGLQEVSVWKSAPAAVGGPAGFYPTGPFVTDYDALALLLKDLADLGRPYKVVVKNRNFSNDLASPPNPVPPLPFVSGPGPSFGLATFTDYDVILVKKSSLGRSRIRVGETSSHTFKASLQVQVAGQMVSVPRGWSAADITVRGREFTFMNTHFEAYSFPGDPLKDFFRNKQAAELATVIKGWPHPVVLVGDVNVRPTMCAQSRPGTPQYPGDQNVVAYQTLLDAGLTEVWPMVHPKDPCGSAGWTSGQDSLTSPMSTLDHRIDDVFVSKGFSALRAVVVGDEQADRTPSGLWPSDHASTFAKIRLDSAKRR